MKQELEAMECQVNSLIKEAMLLVEKSDNLRGISSYGETQGRNKYPGKYKDKKITKFPDTRESVSPDNSKSLGSLIETTSLSCPNSFPPKQLCIRLPWVMSIINERFILKPNAVFLSRGGLEGMVWTYLTHNCFGGNEFGQDNEVVSLRDPNDLLLSGDTDSLRVICNFPYWLARDLRIARDINILCGGTFVTRIAWSFGLISSVMVDALSVEPRARTFTKKSLVTIEIVMELDGGTYCWPATRGIEKVMRLIKKARVLLGHTGI
nr:hypothetical protein [Tanacetum cinerariifolium]